MPNIGLYWDSTDFNGILEGNIIQVMKRTIAKLNCESKNATSEVLFLLSIQRSFKPSMFIHLTNTYWEFTFPCSLHADFIPLYLSLCCFELCKWLSRGTNARFYGTVSS